MKKTFKRLLLIFIFLLLILLGVLFTQAGNTLVKPYLKTTLEKQIGLPVEVNNFKLRYDNTLLQIVINHGLKITVKSDFNLLTQFFEGTYKIDAQNFIYQELTLKEAHLQGAFQGVPNDFSLNGKGTSFHTPLHYDLRFVNNEAKELHFYVKEMPLSDVLKLTKQPALAKGTVEANISIPTLVKIIPHSKIDLHLSNVTFDDALMKKLYQITLPKTFVLQGEINAIGKDERLLGTVALRSNVADVNLTQLSIHMKTKQFKTNYLIDIVDLKSLSETFHSKLDGVIVLQGKAKKEETLHITGNTNTLGGTITYQLDNKDFKMKLSALPIEHLLSMFQFPTFIDANSTGEMYYNIQSKQGDINLSMTDFKLSKTPVTQSIAAIFPVNPTDIVFGESAFNAQIQGENVLYSLMAKSSEASLRIGEGKVNRKDDTHHATIEFGFNKYAISGSIDGSIRHPHVGFDTKGFLENQMMNEDFVERTEKEVKRFFKRIF